MTFPLKKDHLKRTLEVIRDKPAIVEQPAKKKVKVFDFSIHPKRKIAVKFLYYGWEHDGLVQQANTENTVENKLREALLKTKLIEDWSSCDLSRCGRTDKGVSAFKQVAALVVRSCNTDDPNVFWPEGTLEQVKSSYQSKPELSYLKMLNGVLPPTIKAVAWCDVPRDFSARHGCNMRIYKYSLPKANLNIEKMRDAASRLVGKHDFRNFSQIDMNEARVVMSYVREIFEVTVDDLGSSNDPSGLVELTVKGSGFLWHMIRFIVTVLHEVGRGKEEPEVSYILIRLFNMMFSIVSNLLDVEKFPRRPHYALAVDRPLCLFDCRFDAFEMKWNYDEKCLEKTVRDLQVTMADYLTKARLIRNMIDDLMELPESSEIDLNKGLLEFTQDRGLPVNYVPFKDRSTCDSLEEKLEKIKCKRDAKM
ncbi:unnamed protein product [Auanema sp. JU1783]|nr:unnamed protein product [Auanema sp. JU1783]